MPGPLTGLIPACHTPLDRDGALNLRTVERAGRALPRFGHPQRLRGRDHRRVRLAQPGRADGPDPALVRGRRGVDQGRGARRPQLPARGRRPGRPRAQGGRDRGRRHGPQLLQARLGPGPHRLLRPDRRRGRAPALLLLRHPGHDRRPAQDVGVPLPGPLPHPQPPGPEVLQRRPARAPGMRAARPRRLRRPLRLRRVPAGRPLPGHPRAPSAAPTTSPPRSISGS